LNAVPLAGQIVIDWTEVPQDIGVGFIHNGASDVTVELGTTGGPQTWSFSNQPMGTQNTHVLIVTRTSTPFGDSFPSSNLVLQITDDGDTAYAYGQIAPSFGSNLGLGSVSPLMTFFRFEPADSYPLPLVYGASRTYEYGYTIALSPVMDLRNDSYGYETIDAYGTVIIPYDTFNCLRMCSFDTSISKLLVGGFPVSVDTATHIIYDFLAEEYGLIAHVLSNPGEVNPNFTEASLLERLDDYSSGIEESSVVTLCNFSCQPNPFTNRIDIRCQIVEDGYLNCSSDVSIMVYDASGRLVRQYEQVSVIGHQISMMWDGTDQAGRFAGSGVYFLALNIDGAQFRKKVLLIK